MNRLIFKKYITFSLIIVFLGFLTNSNSKVIVPESYYLSAYIENGKVGFRDSVGNIHIKPQYIETGEFKSGLCPVKTESGKWVYIDKYNVKVWKEKSFRLAKSFSDGYAAVLPEFSSYWRFIDTKGNFVGEEYIAVKDFRQGFCAVSLAGNGWNFIGKDFKTIFEKDFFHCGNFGDGLVAVFDEYDSCYKYLDIKGETAITLSAVEYNAVSQFINGLAAVCHKGKWGFINKAGVFVIKPEFEVLMPFFEGFAAARLGGKWGFIKEDGEFHIKPFILDSNDFYVGHLSDYRKIDKNLTGAIDFFGERKILSKKDIFPVIIDFEKKLVALRFSEGKALFNRQVRNSMKYGFIDRSGKVVVRPVYDTVTPFEYGFSRVTKNGVADYLISSKIK